MHRHTHIPERGHEKVSAAAQDGSHRQWRVAGALRKSVRAARRLCRGLRKLHEHTAQHDNEPRVKVGVGGQVMSGE